MLKSLEIVNEHINYLSKMLIVYQNLDDTTMIVHINQKLEIANQIKQDLEVLEILRKHYKDIKVRPRLFNIKDLKKIKQWFESNKVGDSNA